MRPTRSDQTARRAAEIISAASKDASVAARALLFLQTLQTDDERASNSTIYRNQRGFSQVDAGRANKLCKEIETSNRRSDNWEEIENIVCKYSEQIAIFATDEQLSSIVNTVEEESHSDESDGMPPLQRRSAHVVLEYPSDSDEDFIVPDRPFKRVKISKYKSMQAFYFGGFPANIVGNQYTQREVYGVCILPVSIEKWMDMDNFKIPPKTSEDYQLTGPAYVTKYNTWPDDVSKDGLTVAGIGQHLSPKFGHVTFCRVREMINSATVFSMQVNGDQMCKAFTEWGMASMLEKVLIIFFSDSLCQASDRTQYRSYMLQSLWSFESVSTDDADTIIRAHPVLPVSTFREYKAYIDDALDGKSLHLYQRMYLMEGV